MSKWACHCFPSSLLNPISLSTQLQRSVRGSLSLALHMKGPLLCFPNRPLPFGWLPGLLMSELRALMVNICPPGKHLLGQEKVQLTAGTLSFKVSCSDCSQSLFTVFILSFSGLFLLKLPDYTLRGSWNIQRNYHLWESGEPRDVHKLLTVWAGGSIWKGRV